MIADGAIKGSPFLSRRRGSNVSIADSIAEEGEDDLDELKALGKYPFLINGWKSLDLNRQWVLIKSEFCRPRSSQGVF